MAKILKVENSISDKAIIEEAGQAIANGKTVIFPTETVYGLGANALDESAAERIYKAKGRPSDNPLIVHISDLKMLDSLVEEVSENAKLLIEKFWPGPLTLIFKKSEKVPYKTTGGLETVAVRMPSNEIARALIKSAGVPIAAPSANISGKPSITEMGQAVAEMSNRVDFIMISERSEIGLESTVIDTTGDNPIILRPGKIGKIELGKYFPNIEFDPGIENKDIKPKSPGVKYTHYKPNAKVYISKDKATLKTASTAKIQNGVKCRVLCMEEDLDYYKPIGLSIGKNIEEVGQNLFYSLRQADEDKIEEIYVGYFTEGDMADAIMNRLKKAGEFI